MKQRFNKPIVFLSHSKGDVEFIKRIQADLKNCQIDTWFDEDDIRHGQPWMDAIFEEGIPNCDGIIVYLTPNSLSSSMVSKEINAAMLHQLAQAGVSFLPYVNDPEIRKQLRYDLQSVQIPVWNESNYHDLFGKVVAEIWRSYMERRIQIAVKDEKNLRLQAELDLEKMKQSNHIGPFSSSEVADFDFIYNKLNRFHLIELRITRKRVLINYTIGREVFKSFDYNDIQSFDRNVKINILDLFSLLSSNPPYLEVIKIGMYLFDSSFMENIDLPNDTEYEKNELFIVNDIQHIFNEMIMYGLVKQSNNQPNFSAMNYIDFSEKFERFKYFMEYKNIFPKQLTFELVNENHN